MPVAKSCSRLADLGIEDLTPPGFEFDPHECVIDIVGADDVVTQGDGALTAVSVLFGCRP